MHPLSRRKYRFVSVISRISLACRRQIGLVLPQVTRCGRGGATLGSIITFVVGDSGKLTSGITSQSMHQSSMKKRKRWCPDPVDARELFSRLATFLRADYLWDHGLRYASMDRPEARMCSWEVSRIPVTTSSSPLAATRLGSCAGPAPQPCTRDRDEVVDDDGPPDFVVACHEAPEGKDERREASCEKEHEYGVAQANRHPRRHQQPDCRRWNQHGRSPRYHADQDGKGSVDGKGAVTEGGEAGGVGEHWHGHHPRYSDGGPAETQVARAGRRGAPQPVRGRVPT